MWFLYPWILISAQALLTKNDSPTDEEISIAIEGNLCRCTGYQQIVDSIRAAAEIHRGEVEPAPPASDYIQIHIQKDQMNHLCHPTC